MAKSIKPKGRRGKVPSAEATVRLIDSTIELFYEIPFDEVSVRRITDRADLNPSTVLRNFGTVENLYIAVSVALLHRSTARLGADVDSAALRDPDVILRTKLLAWLLANGTEPSVISASRDDESVRFMIESLAKRAHVSTRMASAFNEILAYSAEGYVVFSDVHTDDGVVRDDILTLMVKFQDLLAQIETELGWQQPLRGDLYGSS